MTEGVNNQETAAPEKPVHEVSDKERNFRRLEAAREAEREARIRAEVQAQAMQREIENIKMMLQPKEKDLLEGVEDYIDKDRFRAIMAQKEAQLKREAEAIARKTYAEMEAQRQKEEKDNFQKRLRSSYEDFDDVMTEENILKLERSDPEFLETVLDIEDPYKRREKTYKRVKKELQKSVAPSVKEKVQENLQNPFYIPSSHGTSNQAIDFDVRTPAAKKVAYEKLKNAQRNPIGSGMTR